ASPLILAAGTAGYVDELDGVTDLSASGGVGAVVTKSITRDSREGNATWRIIEHKAGMLNAIGLANVGLDAFGRDVVPSIDAFVRRGGAKVIGSISGFSIDEFVAV
ncbi:MAG: dihydroorotate dehydrogenase, partial [Phycisphaerae bacterium]